MSISKRKREHITIALSRSVRFREKTAGFEKVDFVHCALPELDYEEVNPETEFLGRRLSFPFMITAITGGFQGAQRINAILSEACQAERIAFGVGSQRQLFENHDHLESYRIVRQKAPDIPVVGNIGASQVIHCKDLSPFQRLVEWIQADALAIHLNPLQERLQPEGSGRFRGVLQGIERLATGLGLPIAVKEVGCGISREVALRLKEAGVHILDIAGAGGTSWAAIESYRSRDNRLAKTFWDWGIPTALSLRMVRDIPGLTLIASGGIDGGVTLAKAIALGAHLGGAAFPFLTACHRKGSDGVISEIRTWREAFRTVLWLTGSPDPHALRREGVLYEVR